MGVKGLSQFLRNKYPAVFRPSDLSDYKGLRFAVDVSIFLYKFSYCKDPDDDHIFLEKFLTQYQMFCGYGIKAVYVFDGLGEHVGKEVERAKRGCQLIRATELRNAKIDALQMSMVDGSVDNAPMLVEGTGGVNEMPVDVTRRNREIGFEIDRLRLAVTTVKPIHSTNLKVLFQSHGIPFYEAVGEAEKACAWLASEGVVDVVVSEDYDTLACGAPRLLRNLGSKKYPLLELRLDEILLALKLTYVEFVDFCILCGTDFNRSLPLIGPVKALLKIRQHGCIERVLLSEPVHAGNADVMAGFTFEMARSKFLDASYQLTSAFLDLNAVHISNSVILSPIADTIVSGVDNDEYALSDDLIELYAQFLSNNVM